MNRTLLAHLAAAAAALSAGTSVVATRHLVGDIDPAALAFWRYLIGVGCFAPFLPRLWPSHRLNAGDLASIAALGVLFFVLFPWAFNASLQFIPAARGAVGLATIPIQTLIVAVLFGREKLSGAKVLGVALAFTGVALVFGPEAIGSGLSDTLLGDALMLLGVLCAAVYSVFSRASLARHGALFVTAMAMSFAVVVLLPLSAVVAPGDLLPDLDIRGWLLVAFLGSFAGAVQFSLFTWALRWLPPSTTVLYITLNSITAMALGALLLGEALRPPLIAGLALVIAAILIGNGALAHLWRKLRPAGTPAE